MDEPTKPERRTVNVPGPGIGQTSVHTYELRGDQWVQVSIEIHGEAREPDVPPPKYTGQSVLINPPPPQEREPAGDNRLIVNQKEWDEQDRRRKEARK